MQIVNFCLIFSLLKNNYIHSIITIITTDRGTILLKVVTFKTIGDTQCWTESYMLRCCYKEETLSTSANLTLKHKFNSERWLFTEWVITENALPEVWGCPGKTLLILQRQYQQFRRHCTKMRWQRQSLEKKKNFSLTVIATSNCTKICHRAAI